MPDLALLPGRFAICRLGAEDPLPDWAAGKLFCSATRTPDELSVVCPEENLPEGTVSEKSWCCLKVKGPLNLNQAGVLASLAVPLRNADVSLFTVSTYLTDYLLLKAEDLEAAVRALAHAGHGVFSHRGERLTPGD